MGFSSHFALSPSSLGNEIHEAANAAAAVNRGRGSLDDFNVIRSRHGSLIIAAIFHAAESAKEVVADITADEDAARNSKVASCKCAGCNGDDIVHRLHVVSRQQFRIGYGDRARNFFKRLVQTEEAVGRLIRNHIERIDARFYRNGSCGQRQLQREIQRHLLAAATVTVFSISLNPGAAVVIL